MKIMKKRNNSEEENEGLEGKRKRRKTGAKKFKGNKRSKAKSMGLDDFKIQINQLKSANQEKAKEVKVNSTNSPADVKKFFENLLNCRNNIMPNITNNKVNGMGMMPPSLNSLILATFLQNKGITPNIPNSGNFFSSLLSVFVNI